MAQPISGSSERRGSIQPVDIRTVSEGGKPVGSLQGRRVAFRIEGLGKERLEVTVTGPSIDSMGDRLRPLVASIGAAITVTLGDEGVRLRVSEIRSDAQPEGYAPY